MRPQMMKRFAQVSAVTIPPTKYRSDCSKRFLDVKRTQCECELDEMQFYIRKGNVMIESAPFPC